MPFTDVSIYNEYSISPVGTHQVLVGTNTNVTLEAPDGANVIMFQPTNTSSNHCRVVVDYESQATSGYGFRYDTTMSPEILYLTDNAKVNVWLNTTTTFDYQWFRLVKGN